LGKYTHALSLESGSAYTRTFGIATRKRPVALSPEMIESSRDPMVVSTIDCAVPAGKTMTTESGSVPCSIVMLRGVDASGEAEGAAIGFVDGCAATRGAVCAEVCELSISTTAGLRGMLTNSTYRTTKVITKDRHSAAPIVSDEPLRDPCR
jgi:hypothetical protein